jgi:hypothetical protein
MAEKSSGRLLLPLPSSSASSHGIFLSDLNQNPTTCSKLLVKEQGENHRAPTRVFEPSASAAACPHACASSVWFPGWVVRAHWPNSFWRGFAKFRLKQQL